MRKTSLIALCCIAALLAGYVGFRSYKVWKQKHLVEMARGFLAKSDNHNAALCLEQALKSNPQNVGAARLMAQLCEAQHSPSALLWRGRVVELAPQSLEDHLALAQTALTMGDISVATNALAGMVMAGSQNATYHNVAGIASSAASQPAQAEMHFLEAIRLDPQNPAPDLNLAVLRIHGTNALALAEGRTTLKRIATAATNSAVRCQALRELIGDAMRQKDEASALTLSGQLLGETNSAFTDRLLRLDVLKAVKSGEFQPTLASYQREVSGDAIKIFELGRWLVAKTPPNESLAWLHTLPMTLQTNQSIALLIVQCQIASQDWRGLNASLEKQRWGELEFLRHAFVARAFVGLELVAASKLEWEQALKMINNQKQGMVMLLRLAGEWKWMTEAEDILWAIINHYPSETWAFDTLEPILASNGRTRSLLQLYGLELKRTPGDMRAKNNVAMLALLLDAKELKPHEVALELYTRNPTNAVYASTYALSLHLLRKDAEALKVLEQLKLQDLENPSVSGYYGVILQATGNRAKAKTFLDLALKGKLLPEERKIFETAKL